MVVGGCGSGKVNLRLTAAIQENGVSQAALRAYTRGVALGTAFLKET
jgi:hypothetical protein